MLQVCYSRESSLGPDELEAEHTYVDTFDEDEDEGGACTPRTASPTPTVIDEDLADSVPEDAGSALEALTRGLNTETISSQEECGYVLQYFFSTGR